MNAFLAFLSGTCLGIAIGYHICVLDTKPLLKRMGDLISLIEKRW